MPSTTDPKPDYTWCQFVNPELAHEGGRCTCFDIIVSKDQVDKPRPVGDTAPTTPFASRRNASAVDTPATSVPPVPALVALGTSVSKGRVRSPDHGHLPLHPHIHHPRVVDQVLTAPHVRFLFPSAYLYDVLVRASFAQCLLVSDCTANRDYPLHCFFSECLYCVEDAPHHLIISLPSCTLCVSPMSDIWLIRFKFSARFSHTIQPP
jgi:hypothetical protein